MSEATPPTEPSPAPAPLPDGPEQAGRPRGRKRRAAWRWSRRLSTIAVALVAAFFVSFFTVDLGRVSFRGQTLRSLAEQYGSEFLERPLHIGAISAEMSPGVFVLSDLMIEGLDPGDRPFFQARRIRVHVPWWTMFSNRIELEVEIVDWEMVVESWEGGRHNLPKLTPDRESSGPKRFTTTVRFAHANDGAFIYDDHGAPWSVVAPDLNFSLVRSETYGTYLGRAHFAGGTVQISDFLPMATEMTTRFRLDGGLVQLEHIDLLTDGAVSHVTGEVDFGNWPEQTYNVYSTVDFPRMREIFFARESWDLSGEGEFRGVFHIYDGGRDLVGEFSSAEAGVNRLRFPNLQGSLEWLDDRFRVTYAEADLYGGRTAFSYGLAPLGTPYPAAASFTARYADVDLAAFLDVFELTALEPVGRATGDLTMAWRNGSFGATKTGDGRVAVTAAEATLAPARLLPGFRPAPIEPPVTPDAFDPRRGTGALPMGADVDFRIEPDRLVFDDSWAATESTYVAFSGETEYGEASRIPFHVTSLDWQASDRLLAAIMTAFGAPTGAVQVGGFGSFDGMMTESFSQPRVEGRFDSEAMRAWDVTWGRARGDIVIQNGYLDITDGRIGEDAGAGVRADGRFALGYPRRDGGEEINAHVVLTNWPLADIRHAFGLDDWPVDGLVALADLRLQGRYEGPFGDGELRLERGVAWGETFPMAQGNLEFDGENVRLHAIEMTKRTDTVIGIVTGDARIGWDGTYSFIADADDDPIPVESLDNFTLGPDAPLTGLMRFTSVGEGRFAHPRYEFSGSIGDLFVGDEGIGQVTGRLTVDGDQLTIAELNVTETRVQLSGSGTIALAGESDARLAFRFLDTSIDPYLKFVGPEVSPFTAIIASGRLQVAGPLADVPHLRVEATIDEALVTPLDYELRNDGPVRLLLEDNRVRLEQVRFRGLNTQLDLSGGVDLDQETIDITTAGDTDLAILAVFLREITAEGTATVSARLQGPLAEPALSGQATIANGNIRHFDLPHSLTAITGPIRIGGSRIDVSGLRARMGEGDVTFDGAINLRGYRPEEFDVRATGQLMRLRYPEGFTSQVNAALELLGPVEAPRLSGTVEVLTVDYRLPITASANLLDLAGGGESPELPVVSATETGFPLLFDIGILVPQMPLIQNTAASIDGSAMLRFTGTVDRPSLTGRVAIDGGELFFEGNRYTVRQGVIDFDDFPRLPLVFDVEAMTRPRAAGQTYEVTVRMTGTFDELTPTLTSDPWLPATDVVTLLFGGTPDLGTAEQRALQSSAQSQERMLQTAGAVLLASPVSGTLSSVVSQVLPLSTVQVSPVLIGEQTASLQQLNPSARFTVGQRITSQLYLTYSRVLGSTQDEIILLEYDQNDRVSWVLSRNENRTFALDFRIRYVF